MIRDDCANRSGNPIPDARFFPVIPEPRGGWMRIPAAPRAAM